MKKRLFATLLCVIMCLSVSGTALAAESADSIIGDNSSIMAIGGSEAVPYGGVETWYYTGYISRFVGSFTMEGRNLTPVKTIATDPNNNRYLTIDAEFTCNSPSILTVEIREYPSGRVLASRSSGVTTSGEVIVQAGSSTSYMSGKQVQIFFRITDANGNYIDNRQCNISYWYTLRGIGDDGLQ